MSHPTAAPRLVGDIDERQNMQPQAAIEVQGLTKVYPGGVEAVKGIDFSVAPGEVFSLLGPNGAGKSTTIGMLTSTVAPTSGTAKLGGFDVARQPLDARRISSVLFQDPVVDRPLSGRRNLEIHASLWGLTSRASEQRIEEIIGAFDLMELVERPVETFSGGERRRLEIARALVSSPQVLFLDEPTVGLDPRIRHELLDVIGGLRDRTEMTILLTTHYLDEAQRLSDRIAIMRSGEIVAMGSPEELIARLGARVVEARVVGDPGRALASLKDAGVAREGAFSVGSTLIVPTGAQPDVVASGFESLGVATISLVVRRSTLDDVYLSLTGEDLPAAA
jgi:ABC-2 type transport system ATP-binding protein